MTPIQFPFVFQTRCLFAELCVDIDNLLHLVIAAEEDTGPVMDVLGNDFQHALHLAVDGLTASCNDAC